MVLGVVGTAGAGTPGGHAPAGLLVFAAASLSDALEEVDRAFTARTGVRVNAAYAASSVLAKQRRNRAADFHPLRVCTAARAPGRG
jgi:molybdate transport system substrate-binding protein